jgi:hypothetical protein
VEGASLAPPQVDQTYGVHVGETKGAASLHAHPTRSHVARVGLAGAGEVRATRLLVKGHAAEVQQTAVRAQAVAQV